MKPDQIMQGVCCQFCLHYETKACPIKTASPWSRNRDFCSTYEKRPDVQWAVDQEDGIIKQIRTEKP